MSQTVPAKQPTSRRFMSWMLKSPFHVFMGDMLLITVTGRKSGRAYSTPVNYVKDGDTILITSKVDRTWWRNLRGGAPVTLVLHGQTYRGAATVIEGHPQVDQALLRFFRLTRRTIAGIHLDENGQPKKPEKFDRVTQVRVVIEIKQIVKQ